MMTAMKKKPTLTRARILKVLREHEDLLRRYSVKRLGYRTESELRAAQGD